jgi:hypothetical protein
MMLLQDLNSGRWQQASILRTSHFIIKEWMEKQISYNFCDSGDGEPDNWQKKT